MAPAVQGEAAEHSPAASRYDELAAMLRGAGRVALISHRSPDGDTIGSGLALAAGLRGLGHSVVLACSDPIPPSLRFLEGWELYTTTLEGVGDLDLVVAVDCADISQLGALGFVAVSLTVGEGAAPGGLPLVNLDHHRSNSLYGTVNVVDDGSASVAEMIYLLLGELGAVLSPSCAQALLTGVINDTHSFQNSNSTAASLRISADLVERGADPSVITYHLFRSRRPQAAELWRRVLPTLALADDGRVASLQVTTAALEEAGADPRGDTDGMVDFLSGIIGVDLAIVVKQIAPASSKASLRTSSHVDAIALTRRFGGGGHSRAAGCDIPSAPAEAVAALLAVYHEVTGER